MTQHIGIWLDYKEAHIIQIQNGQSTILHVPSLIDTGKVKGGSGSKVAYGPQDNRSESKFLAIRNQQIKQYIERILERLKGKADFLLFGPGHMKYQLLNALTEDTRFKGHKIDIQTTDSMTSNQLVAYTKTHFNISPKWQLS